MTPTLQDSTFRQLRDYIYAKSGIFIPDSKKYLIENRLLKRVQERNLPGFEEYLQLLQYGNNGEIAGLFDAVTTNETYFFRETQQLDVFIGDIVPRVLSVKKTRDISIWSAAASTGEEPYNLVMLLRERSPLVRAQVMGSDISQRALDSARRAVYTSYSVRNVPQPYLGKYFRPNGQTFELDGTIKSSVVFRIINLLDEKDLKTVRPVDVIFCRNVLIYFDDKAKQKAVSYLYDRLRPGGYLFVGSSESLHNVTRAFKPVVINKVVVYQRGE
ncbi:MAG: protein-glutamate O-methyltransferase CheR [Nitrospirales bacterium]|nr:protein-glutamate O-methyltransferase CheR [Nitrospirales bacterium]